MFYWLIKCELFFIFVNSEGFAQLLALCIKQFGDCLVVHHIGDNVFNYVVCACLCQIPLDTFEQCVKMFEVKVCIIRVNLPVVCYDDAISSLVKWSFIFIVF